MPTDPVPASPFSPTALNKAVHDTLDQALAALPAGKNNAVLIDATYSTTDGPRAKALFVHRVKDNWTVALEGAYDGPHGVQGKVATAITW